MEKGTSALERGEHCQPAVPCSSRQIEMRSFTIEAAVPLSSVSWLSRQIEMRSFKIEAAVPLGSVAWLSRQIEMRSFDIEAAVPLGSIAWLSRLQTTGGEAGQVAGLQLPTSLAYTMIRMLLFLFLFSIYHDPDACVSHHWHIPWY